MMLMATLLNVIQHWRARNFIQIFLQDNNVKLRNIKNGTIDTVVDYNVNNIDGLLFYLNAYSKVPVDIIVHPSNMFAKNMASQRMNNSDVESMLEKTLMSKKCNFNTVFYINKKSIRGENNISVCETNLDDISASVLNSLLNLNNQINSISCWPLWVCDNYFSFFANDIQKFKCSLFAIKHDNFSEIIAVDKYSKILCHRQLSDVSSENEETANTIQYITRTHNIKSEDVALYCITNDTIETFTKSSNVHMSYVSHIIPSTNLIFGQYQNSIKTALKAMCCLCAVGISFQCFDMVSLNQQIKESNDFIESFPASIVSEKPIWEKIDDALIEGVNFQKLISEILANTEKRLIKSLELDIDENKNITINMLKSDDYISIQEFSSVYSKEMRIDNYALNVSVLEDRITCSGKRC